VTLTLAQETPGRSLQITFEEMTLTSDRIFIGTAESQFSRFCCEYPNVGDYTMSIPSDTPPGTYYVGAIVSVNGFGSDGFTQNNATSFYRTITVTCSGTYSVSPASPAMPRGGGANSVTVTSDGSACGFAASSNVSWLTITSGASGTGSGTIHYSVAANTSIFSRSGHITVGGVTHTVVTGSFTLNSTSTLPIGSGSVTAAKF
jgi:hypothetical protein